MARTLVVYYASETTDAAVRSPHYRALIAALEASPAPAAAAALNSLRIEAATFPNLVKSDIAALREAAPRLGFDLVVFTNLLAAQGRFAQVQGDGGWQERPLVLPSADTSDAVLDFAPLARPAALAAALANVGLLADKGIDEVVLILKSHGSETMAVMPRVVADLSRPGSAQDLLARLAANDDARDGVRAARPAWAEPKGISKIELWQALGVAGERHGLRFALVVLDSCRSGLLSLGEYRRVPHGVGTIVHSGSRDVAFGQIDYGRALAQVPTGARLAGPLAAGLENFLLEVEGPLERPWREALLILEQVPAILLFVPLVLWLAWYVVRPRLVARRPH